MTAAFCGQCGTVLRTGARFCPNCGADARDDDTADREMPAWFANGEVPPQEVVSPAVTVTRALKVADAPPSGFATQARGANLYVWVGAAVAATAAVAAVIALLLWPSSTAPSQAASRGAEVTTTTSTTTIAPTTTTGPTVATASPTAAAPTSPSTRANWRSWISLDTHPSTIRNFPCRQMAAHDVPYDFVMDYFHRWNWFYLQEGGGGMDQDGNGLPCEGQYPDAGLDGP